MEGVSKESLRKQIHGMYSSIDILIVFIKSKNVYGDRWNEILKINNCHNGKQCNCSRTIIVFSAGLLFVVPIDVCFTFEKSIYSFYGFTEML